MCIVHKDIFKKRINLCSKTSNKWRFGHGWKALPQFALVKNSNDRHEISAIQMCTVDVQQPIDISVILWTLLTIAEWQKWASFAETFKASFDGEMVDPPEKLWRENNWATRKNKLFLSIILVGFHRDPYNSLLMFIIIPK